MYTPVRVRVADGGRGALDGHCYDVSAGGLQFELDHAVPAGTAIVVDLVLPALPGGECAARRAVRAMANVVWTDESEPGPVRMAAAFTGFASDEDRRALVGHGVRASSPRVA